MSDSHWAILPGNPALTRCWPWLGRLWLSSWFPSSCQACSPACSLTRNSPAMSARPGEPTSAWSKLNWFVCFVRKSLFNVTRKHKHVAIMCIAIPQLMLTADICAIRNYKRLWGLLELNVANFYVRTKRSESWRRRDVKYHETFYCETCHSYKHYLSKSLSIWYEMCFWY